MYDDNDDDKNSNDNKNDNYDNNDINDDETNDIVHQSIMTHTNKNKLFVKKSNKLDI